MQALQLACDALLVCTLPNARTAESSWKLRDASAQALLHLTLNDTHWDSIRVRGGFHMQNLKEVQTIWVVPTDPLTV